METPRIPQTFPHNYFSFHEQRFLRLGPEAKEPSSPPIPESQEETPSTSEKQKRAPDVVASSESAVRRTEAGNAADWTRNEVERSEQFMANQLFECFLQDGRKIHGRGRGVVVQKALERFNTESRWARGRGLEAILFRNERGNAEVRFDRVRPLKPPAAPQGPRDAARGMAPPARPRRERVSPRRSPSRGPVAQRNVPVRPQERAVTSPQVAEGAPPAPAVQEKPQEKPPVNKEQVKQAKETQEQEPPPPAELTLSEKLRKAQSKLAEEKTVIDKMREAGASDEEIANAEATVAPLEKELKSIEERQSKQTVKERLDDDMKTSMNVLQDSNSDFGEKLGAIFVLMGSLMTYIGAAMKGNFGKNYEEMYGEKKGKAADGTKPPEPKTESSQTEAAPEGNAQELPVENVDAAQKEPEQRNNSPAESKQLAAVLQETAERLAAIVRREQSVAKQSARDRKDAGLFGKFHRALTGSDPFEIDIKNSKQRIATAEYAETFLGQAKHESDPAQKVDLINIARRLAGMRELNEDFTVSENAPRSSGLNRMDTDVERYNVEQKAIDVSEQVARDAIIAAGTAPLGAGAVGLKGAMAAGARIGGEAAFAGSVVQNIDAVHRGEKTMDQAAKDIVADTAEGAATGAVTGAASHGLARGIPKVTEKIRRSSVEPPVSKPAPQVDSASTRAAEPPPKTSPSKSTSEKINEAPEQPSTAGETSSKPESPSADKPEFPQEGKSEAATSAASETMELLNKKLPPHVILGISEHATPDQIRAAHHALAKKYHPDHHPGNAIAEQNFKIVQDANDILTGKIKPKRKQQRKAA